MLFILVLPRIICHALVWLALAALLGLSGCGTLKLVYNNSDDLIYWWLDGYVDLQDGQKQFTRRTLSDLQRWHRQQQLPEYGALLQRMQQLAPHDITPAQVCAMTDDMQKSFVKLMHHIEPAATQLAVQLSPAQLRSVRKRFDKTNQEWRADWLDPEAPARLRYRTKQALNRLEDFYGRLDKPQREVLHQWLSESLFDPVQSYAERERRQADTLQTLQRMTQNAPANAPPHTLFKELVERSLTPPLESHRSYAQALWKDNCEGFAKLHNSTTPAQRQRMVEALRGYERDFSTLMAPR